jgi:hypothetical protein
VESSADIKQIWSQLRAALELVPHDRWLLAGLRENEMLVITESSRRRRRRGATRSIPPLARRSLLERRPLSVSAVEETPPPRRLDWERTWPSILYLPVGFPLEAPVGILIVGSRLLHWYTQEEVEYLSAIAMVLAGPVALALDSPAIAG